MKKINVKVLLTALSISIISTAPAFAAYQWDGNSCDLVTPDGTLLHPFNDGNLCGGTTYQWDGDSCDLVTPDGTLLHAYNDPSLCG